MYELTLAHLTTAEHERDLEADLRQRRILKASDAVRRAVTADLGNTNDAALALRPQPRDGPGPGSRALRTTAMPHDVISTCPVCSSELAVTRLHCRSCGTTLEGDFSVGRFGRLNREQLALLESFLRSRGNLREMERELGISYPTVRSRVEALVRALGFGPRADSRRTGRRGHRARPGRTQPARRSCRPWLATR